MRVRVVRGEGMEGWSGEGWSGGGLEREGWRRREVKWWKKGAKEIFMHVYLSRCSHTTPLRAFLFHTHTHTHTHRFP